MTVPEVIAYLRAQDVDLLPEGKALRILVPKGLVIPAEVKTFVDSHIREIKARLQAEAITPADILEVFPGACDITDDLRWLGERLKQPQRIARVIAEWVGPRQRLTGRTIEELLEVCWALGVEAYIGLDDRSWWRLPQRTLH